MDDKRRDALREISEEVGFDLVEYADATAKAARELADDKVEHKEMTEKAKVPIPKEDEEEEEYPKKKDPKKVDPDKKEIEVAESAAPEVQDTAPAVTDVNAIVDEMVKQAGLKELSETIAAVLSRLEKLETVNEAKAIEEAVETKDEGPRYGFFSWLENSKSRETVLTEDEKAEFKSKMPNTKNSPVARLVENFNL